MNVVYMNWGILYYYFFLLRILIVVCFYRVTCAIDVQTTSICVIPAESGRFQHRDIVRQFLLKLPNLRWGSLLCWKWIIEFCIFQTFAWYLIKEFSWNSRVWSMIFVFFWLSHQIPFLPKLIFLSAPIFLRTLVFWSTYYKVVMVFFLFLLENR